MQTVSSKALDHAVNGSWSHIVNPKKPAGGNNGGNIYNGEHSQDAIDYLEQIKGKYAKDNKENDLYGIEETLPNGVRLGWLRTASS